MSAACQYTYCLSVYTQLPTLLSLLFSEKAPTSHFDWTTFGLKAGSIDKRHSHSLTRSHVWMALTDFFSYLIVSAFQPPPEEWLHLQAKPRNSIIIRWRSPYKCVCACAVLLVCLQDPQIDTHKKTDKLPCRNNCGVYMQHVRALPAVTHSHFS